MIIIYNNKHNERGNMDPKIIEEIGSAVNSGIKTSLSDLRIGMYVVIGAGLLTFIFNIIMTLMSKHQDVNVAVKITKKTVEFEEIKKVYDYIENIRIELTTNPVNKLEIENKIKESRRLVRKNEIIFSDKIIESFNEVLDLLSVAVVDISGRKIGNEKEILKKIKNYYRAIS
jgi:hypothetical protein